MAVGLVLIVWMSRYFMPSFSAFQRFVLKGREQDGYVATELALPKPGAKGKVLATLRPAGKVEIDGRIFDAMSRGEFIEKGVEVTVVNVDESVLVVEA